MCGIIGYIGQRQVVPLIIDGLRKLEYRGYDSAGVAVVLSDRRALHPAQRRQAGKPRDGAHKGVLSPRVRLGHARWATHGRPTEENAHPHRDCHGRAGASLSCTTASSKTTWS